MNKMLIPLLIGSAFSIGQCAFAAESPRNRETPMELSQKHSGYGSGVGDWINFLTCWRNNIPREPQWEGQAFLLSFPDDKTPINNNISSQVQTKYRLPKSVLDFYQAYEFLGGQYRNPKKSDGLGISAPTDVKPLSMYMPDLLEIKNEWPRESSNADYFMYGIEQNDVDIRTRYQANAIVIGQYGYDDYELIVLYPDSLTKDGEMETAIFALASEGRAPSFAEMMRQLSYYFIQSPDSIPIFSQESLIGTCADKLPLKDVWWK